MTYDFIEFKDIFIKQYESLRLVATNKQVAQHQQSYIFFVSKGMVSWLIEESDDKKITKQSLQMEKNDFQLSHQPQLMGTIIGILLKKHKGQK